MNWYHLLFCTETLNWFLILILHRYGVLTLARNVAVSLRCQRRETVPLGAPYSFLNIANSARHTTTDW